MNGGVNSSMTNQMNYTVLDGFVGFSSLEVQSSLV